MTERVRNTISGGVFLSAVIQGRDIRLSLPPAVTSARSGLPAPTPTFCGRADELGTLVAALSPAAGGSREKLLTVRGIAGVGKTELVLQAARVALSNGWFPGGALYAGTRGRGGPAADQILDGFLRALGVPAARIPAAPADKTRLYALILEAFARQGKRVLVLVDDATSGRGVSSLLPAHAAGQAIVACREPGEVPAGIEVTVRALTPAMGAELLQRVLNVAHADDPRVAADIASAVRISDLCGGHPLALRIAGARLAEDPAMPLASVANDLQEESSRLDELEYLGNGVRVCFDRAYGDLDPETARVFRQLSLHPGPSFSAAEIASLAGENLAQISGRLPALGSLLEQDAPGERWRMPVLVRLYAKERGLSAAS